MTEQIELGGKKRPARFNNAGMLEYEQQTGRKVLADLASFSDVSQLSISTIVELVYYGLLCGHRKAGVNVDFDKYDVAEWIEQSPGVVQQAIESYSKALENSFSGNGQQGKPQAATPTK